MKFANSLGAEKAIKGLHGVHSMEAGRPPLKVTVPSVKPKRGIEQMMGGAGGAYGSQGNSGYVDFKLFVGGVPTTASEEDVRQVFQQFGNVKVNKLYLILCGLYLFIETIGII